MQMKFLSSLSFAQSLCKSLCILSLFFLSGCGGYESDDSIMSSAHNALQNLNDRYRELTSLLNQTDEEVVDAAERYGKELRVDGLWGFFYTLADQDYLTSYNGAPLHKLVCFIEWDIATISKHISVLESRFFTHLALYKDLRALRRELQDIASIVKASHRHTEEVRVLDSRSLQRAQIRETRKQNDYIMQSLVQASRPATVYEETTTTMVKKKKPVPRVVVAHEQESVNEINVDDIPVGASIIV
jgi:hypothetical protein